jgi:NADH dehydrogenase (ubiquinone) 1 beta subcomplex subunit 8
MLQRIGLKALRPIQRTATASLRNPSLPLSSHRHASTTIEIDPNVTDPGMNGGYPQLAPIKRQHRDPYGDWWDKQERRNFGEPLHEDNDILGIFATEDYTWTTPGWGAVLMGCFVASFAGVSPVLYYC